MNALQFITASLVTSIALVSISKALTGSPEAVVVHRDTVPTIYETPSLDQRAGWCRGDKGCKKLAEMITWEARGEPLEGRYAVAWVVLNRVQHSRWGDDILSVVNERKQFSYLQDMKHQSPPTQKDWTEAFIVAYDVLHGDVVSPVWDANHYHSVSVNPSWNKDMELVAQIGNHIFYR